MTIQEALNVTNRSVSNRDAEVFLQYALGVERTFLLTHGETALTSEQAATYESFLSRREQNEPVAYIVGEKEFYGRPFKTDARALIPRPETELLVDKALELLPARFKAHTKAINKPCPIRILEIGTGSGNIAVTLSLELAKYNTPAEIYATDISPEALALAEENFTLLQNGTPHSPIKWFVANLFNNAELQKKAPYDLVIANLPYVPTSWKFDAAAQPEVVFQEPDIALFGGEDGLDLYRGFFAKVSGWVMKDGIILVEYGEDETGDISELVRSYLPTAQLIVHKDYAELDRMLEIRMSK
jgi:release factor glutamine methyltransferase